jgi:hypothetical protein
MSCLIVKVMDECGDGAMVVDRIEKYISQAFAELHLVSSVNR